MWIRSQNKETLINCNVIEYNDFYVENGIVATSETISRVIVGKYSTKEKALKVLDMIQGCITGNVLQSYEIARDCPLAGIEFNGVFNIPQDEEVEK